MNFLKMAEIYTLTKNHAVNLSSNRMNVYLLPGTQEAMLELALPVERKHRCRPHQLSAGLSGSAGAVVK